MLGVADYCKCVPPPEEGLTGAYSWHRSVPLPPPPIVILYCCYGDSIHLETLDVSNIDDPHFSLSLSPTLSRVCVFLLDLQQLLSSRIIIGCDDIFGQTSHIRKAHVKGLIFI